MALEVGDIVLCTVESIVGTNVFVTLDSGEEGCIVFSEVAPGRIRNIREYVVPQKKIVCKVLRLSSGRIDLSLRRVTMKEQKELKEAFKLEKSYESILKGILKEKVNEVKKEILKQGSIHEFLENSKENPNELERIVGKDDSKKILEIISAQQKKKKVVLKKEITLTTTDPDGVSQIKKIFEEGFQKNKLYKLNFL